MQRANKFITYAVIAILLFISLLLTGGGVPVANAATSSYSYVLNDLKQDESFNVDEYPERVKDYSINIINIAESVNGELFIYTYQPSGQRMDLKASSINISREEDNAPDMSFSNYALTLLNSNGVFYKYKVEDFELEKADVRYYNISNILRPFNKKIDYQTSPDETTEVKNAVGQLWTARTVEGIVEYAMTYSEVVTITKKYVGYLQYFNGINFDTGSLVNPDVNASTTLRHFVAFSTDHDIDSLASVEIEYSLQEYQFELCANPVHTISSETHSYKDIINHFPVWDPETLEELPIEKVHDVIKGKKDSNNPHGWWGKKYSWDTIETTSDFLEANEKYDLTTSGVSSIEGTEWVLSFYKQSVDMVSRGNVATSSKHYNGEYNKVRDVIILRLTFEKDGKFYNLGVVDDKRNSDPNPLNPKPISPLNPGKDSGCTGTGCNGCNSSLPWWAWVLIIIFSPLIIFFLIKLIKWIVLAPFRAIAKRRKKRQREKEREYKKQEKANERKRKKQEKTDKRKLRKEAIKNKFREAIKHKPRKGDK